MWTPASTYRLQLRAEFDFADAAAVADYLADLGVTHVFLSPVLQAAPGSTHGYDVVDHSRASTELGGDDRFLALSDRLRSLSLGLVVDIVPNHMSVAVSRLNSWWWDVLLHGETSPYARHFDIDWSRGRLLLPVLGDGPAELDRLAVVGDELRYYDHAFPVAPGTLGGTAAEVHARQAYELASWRRGNAELNYRRFFDITELAAIRVECAEVFRASHEHLLAWVDDGRVEGLRIDHPDGLYDPAGYLSRLADAAPNAWIVAEKILEPGEHLPPDWACAGTTGYDALSEVCGLFCDAAGVSALTELYVTLTGAPAEPHELTYAMKRRAAATVLAAETARLARLAPDLAAAPDALAELMAALPVYRTYLPAHGADVLAAAGGSAVAHRPDLAETLKTLHDRLLDAGTELSTRFEQTSGMVMAKGVEDTTFYRWSRFVAANEVGSDPATVGLSTRDFHAAQELRQRSWPATMTTLSTHDTKRSEDARARLAVLTELPDEWAVVVGGWVDRVKAPDPDLGYLAWQTFVGAWPLPRDRALGYLRKAAREAKSHTSWTDPDPAYEDALVAFVDAFYVDDSLQAELSAFVARIAPYGWSNALGQKLVQLTMPGVPDVYQGSELWDLSLVDPDNRRPVDYAERREVLGRLDAGALPPVDATGAAKLLVVSRTLQLRRGRPASFAGSYEPLLPEGDVADHAVAFGRAGDAVTVATRLPVGLQRRGGWGATTVTLPAGRWTDVLTGAGHDGGPQPLATLLATYPVALLSRVN